MKTEKTIAQWLQTLPLSMRKDGFPGLNLKRINEAKVEHLSEAIMLGFGWDKTMDGVEFWDSFHDALCSAEKMDAKGGRIS